MQVVFIMQYIGLQLWYKLIEVNTVSKISNKHCTDFNETPRKQSSNVPLQLINTKNGYSSVTWLPLRNARLLIYPRVFSASAVLTCQKCLLDTPVCLLWQLEEMYLRNLFSFIRHHTVSFHIPPSYAFSLCHPPPPPRFTLPHSLLLLMSLSQTILQIVTVLFFFGSG